MWKTLPCILREKSPRLSLWRKPIVLKEDCSQLHGALFFVFSFQLLLSGFTYTLKLGKTLSPSFIGAVEGLIRPYCYFLAGCFLLSYLIFKSKVFASLLSVRLGILTCAMSKMKFLKVYVGIFLVVQWLRLHASTAAGAGSIPVRELRVCIPTAMNFRLRILGHLFIYSVFCLYLHRQVKRHPECKIKKKKS